MAKRKPKSPSMLEESMVADLRRQLGAHGHVDEPQEQNAHLGRLIPRDPFYPEDVVQCDHCGGNGCQYCSVKGWLLVKDHPGGRRCANDDCRRPLHPAMVAVYCSNRCAIDDT